MSYFKFYASKAKQSGVLNTDKGLQWINGLSRLDGVKGYIELAPPYSGSGVTRVKTSATFIIENQGAIVAKVRLGIGVNNPNGSAKPLFPYLGVSHGAGDDPSTFTTLGAGQATQITLWRFDIVDNALESDQPIPGWPNWTVQLGQGKTALPSLVICGNNDTPTNKVIYRDVQFDCRVIF